MDAKPTSRTSIPDSSPQGKSHIDMLPRMYHLAGLMKKKFPDSGFNDMKFTDQSVSQSNDQLFMDLDRHALVIDFIVLNPQGHEQHTLVLNHDSTKVDEQPYVLKKDGRVLARLTKEQLLSYTPLNILAEEEARIVERVCKQVQKINRFHTQTPVQHLNGFVLAKLNWLFSERTRFFSSHPKGYKHSYRVVLPHGMLAADFEDSKEESKEEVKLGREPIKVTAKQDEVQHEVKITYPVEVQEEQGLDWLYLCLGGDSTRKKMRLGMKLVWELKYPEERLGPDPEEKLELGLTQYEVTSQAFADFLAADDKTQAFIALSHFIDKTIIDCSEDDKKKIYEDLGEAYLAAHSQGEEQEIEEEQEVEEIKGLNLAILEDRAEARAFMDRLFREIDTSDLPDEAKAAVRVGCYRTFGRGCVQAFVYGQKEVLDLITTADRESAQTFVDGLGKKINDSSLPDEAKTTIKISVAEAYLSALREFSRRNHTSYSNDIGVMQKITFFGLIPASALYAGASVTCLKDPALDYWSWFQHHVLSGNPKMLFVKIGAPVLGLALIVGLVVIGRFLVMKSHEKALEQKIKSQRKNLEALEKEVSSASIASSVGTGSEVEERDEAPDGRPRASSVGTFSPPPEHKLAVRVREGEQDTSPVVRPRSNSSVS